MIKTPIRGTPTRRRKSFTAPPSGIRKLVVYEAPFIVDATHSLLPEDFMAQLKALLAVAASIARAAPDEIP